jgi:protein-disulfide isomerase
MGRQPLIFQTHVLRRKPARATNEHRGKATLAIFAGILALAVIASPQTKPKVAKVAAKVAPTEQSAGPPVKSYGSKSAPITLEVFTDYQCPSCRGFYEQTLRSLINEYVASGKVYLVHHDYPLSAHSHSGEAARWANSAARVGEFDQVEAALYDNQPAWEDSGDIQKYVAAAMSPADFKRVQAQMKGCEGPGPVAGVSGAVSYPPNGKPCPIDAYITPDIVLGTKVPVNATPTFVITYKGKRLAPGSGGVSWPILKQFFDSLLSQ